MRLPIQSMQAVRLRPLVGEAPSWYRSVIVDFEPDRELVVLSPEEKDREVEEGEQAPGEKDQGGNNGTPPEGEVDAQGNPVIASTPAPLQIDNDLLAAPVFEKGTRLEVEISFPDGIRRFNSVVRRLDLNYGGSLRIDWPTEGTRIQRRDYVRVDAAFRTGVSFHREGVEGRQKLIGATMDFSAGGVRLKLPEPLEAELRIEMEIEMPALRAQVLQGRVVRSGEIEKQKRSDTQFYWVAVEFVGVDESRRKDLTQVVFEIQRSRLKRGLS